MGGLGKSGKGGRGCGRDVVWLHKVYFEVKN